MNENIQDAVAKRLLGALAEIDRLLRNHAMELRGSPAVRNAQASLGMALYENGPVLEGYVEAGLANGDSVCWCLDVRWNQDSWTIEATLDRKSGDRQQTVKELPVENLDDLDGFLRALKRIVHELLSLRISEVEIARPQ